ncbi:MAG: putative S-layer protein [Nanoarchaeota archaeon]
MKFTKLFSLFAFLTLSIFLVGFASASFGFTNVVGANQTITGTQATISFDVTPTGHSGTLFNATLILPSLFGSSTQWTGNSANFTVTNSTAVSKTVTVSIPSGQTPGIYTGQISLTGDYVLPSGSASTIPTVNNLSVQLTIPTLASNISLTAPTSPIAVGQNATLTVTNTGGQTLTNIQITETTSPSLGLTFVPQTISSLASSSSTTVQALTNGLGTLKFGLHTAQVRAQSSSGQTATASFQIKKTFCSAGETPTSNVSITNVAWSNDGEGDDNNWEYLDEIELEVDIKNNDNDDEVDVVAKLGFYDSSGKNGADDLIFLEDSDSDDEEIEITIDDDDEETVTWVFKVPADFDKGNYKLAVKVYDEDAGESNSCRDSSNDFDNVFFQSIQVKEASDEGRFVVIDEISLDEQVVCGQTLNGQFTLFNIGDEDQDRVKVLIKNDALNIDEEVELTTDLDKGEDESLDFSVQIPATATNGNYGLEFTTFYDYRNGVYREESEETFDAFIEVIGCSQPIGNVGSGSLTDTVITAELGSEARAGEQLVVKATITNSGTESKSYSVSARDYDEWATLDDISDTSFTLDADESKEITLTFTVDDDAEGSQTFDIQAASEGLVQIQEVEVELEEAKKRFTFDFKDNSFIWVIGLVNLVLIILIIVVAVRLAKR